MTSMLAQPSTVAHPDWCAGHIAEWETDADTTHRAAPAMVVALSRDFTATVARVRTDEVDEHSQVFGDAEVEVEWNGEVSTLAPETVRELIAALQQALR